VAAVAYDGEVKDGRACGTLPAGRRRYCRGLLVYQNFRRSETWIWRGL